MVYLLRQGETDWNRFKKFNGATETFLNQTGIDQCNMQASNLAKVCFDACFCSPQTRTKQTCEIVYKGTPIYDKRLIEIICGEFEGTDENAESFRQFFKAAQDGSKGVETFKSFIARTSAFCDMLVNEYKGKNVLVVTHAANARVINWYFEGKPKDYDFGKTFSTKGGVTLYNN